MSSSTISRDWLHDLDGLGRSGQSSLNLAADDKAVRCEAGAGTVPAPRCAAKPLCAVTRSRVRIFSRSAVMMSRIRELDPA
jgi:hypothetical protein